MQVGRQIPSQGVEEVGKDTRECPCGSKGQPAVGVLGEGVSKNSMADAQGSELSSGLASWESPESALQGMVLSKQENRCPLHNSEGTREKGVQVNTSPPTLGESVCLSYAYIQHRRPCPNLLRESNRG